MTARGVRLLRRELARRRRRARDAWLRGELARLVGFSLAGRVLRWRIKRGVLEVIPLGYLKHITCSVHLSPNE